MTTALYILEGETVVRIKQIENGSQLHTIGGNVEYAIVHGLDGSFGEWQIANLLERLKANRKAKGK